jgi:hypothetical protein
MSKWFIFWLGLDNSIITMGILKKNIFSTWVMGHVYPCNEGLNNPSSLAKKTQSSSQVLTPCLNGGFLHCSGDLPLVHCHMNASHSGEIPMPQIPPTTNHHLLRLLRPNLDDLTPG